MISPTSNKAVELTLYIFGSCVLLAILYFGRGLFIPMSYGLLIAIVTYLPCRWLESRGCSRSVAIFICLTIVILLFAILLLLLGWQLAIFQKDIPELYDSIRPVAARFSKWLDTEWSLTSATQHAWLQRSLQNYSDNLAMWLQLTISSIISISFSLFLIPIYSALFLYHRKVFVHLVYTVFPGRDAIIKPILNEIVNTYHRYIRGMVLVYFIVGILNSVGLLALGIEHAILFGMLTAIMTIIPYVGIIVSAALPVSLAFISTGEPWLPLGVIAVFSFVQYLEANIIFPKVVGAQLNVSTWATLVAIISGGILWGVSGMILFIPFVSIVKIVSSHIPSLQPLYWLLSRNDVK